MKKYIFFLQFVLIHLLFPQSKISGLVFDEESGKPLAYANVYIQSSSEGAMTDEDGNFTFLTRKVGNVKLVASMVGYKKRVIDLKLNDHDSIFVKIKLTPEPINFGEVVVNASSFSNVESKGLSLTQVDVFTVPGGAADIFQTIKTLPGVTPVSESAQIYVRGGDPDETKTIINGVPLIFPFTFESPYGGIFSNINTAFIKNFFFSSGGFSAKYGDALSGVIEIETLDEINRSEFYGNISLAGIGAGVRIPVDNKFSGFHIDMRKSYTAPIFWVNGGASGFSVFPSSEDIAGGIVLRYSRTGKVKLFSLFASDVQGVNVERPEYNGLFDGKTRNYLLNFTASDILYSKFLVNFAGFRNKHMNVWKLGVLDLRGKDDLFGFRFDIDYINSGRFSYLIGFEFESRSGEVKGVIPARDYDFRPGYDGKFINFNFQCERFGIYLEPKFMFRKIFISFSERFDYIKQIKKGWNDIRLSIGLKLSKDATIKFASGWFSQYNRDVKRFGYVVNTGPMRAIHYIISLDGKIAGFVDARIELYNKLYRKLPLKSGDVWDDSGYGYARGVDIILKGGMPGFLNAWISYSFLDSKRKWLDFEVLAPSPYNVKHNFSCVLKYNLSSNLEIGLSYKFSTGRPYTPIIGSIYHQSVDVYEPIYGVKNSGRYPDYQRFDVRLNYIIKFGKDGFAVFYIEMINVLNKRNIMDYTYSRDYSIREPLLSYFGRRTIVFGCFFQI